ncbi:MAG: EAL domain-containing response regulator [Burkholderiales bacterium]
MDKSLKQPAVLIVDDDPVQCKLLADLLGRFDVGQVHQAESGRAAMAMLAQGLVRVDVIVCDLDMPEMDGMLLLRRIAEVGLSPSIIISSASDQNIVRSVESIAQARGFAVLGSLRKPPTAGLLGKLLAKHRELAGKVDQKLARVFDATEVSRALEQGEFEAYFQPKVDLASGRVRGAEALVRWRHPTLGVLAPESFLGHIVDCGGMPKMTWLMIEGAAHWCGKWHKLGMDMNVSVNLSLTALDDPRLALQIVDLLRDNQLPSKSMVFEVTETSAMKDVAGCLETLSRLKMHGFGLSLDDFGTGFSTLQQLARIPFSELKLDRSFVNGATQQPHLRAVIVSTVGMAKNLGLEVVAEGVETIEDWRFLREVGVDMAQGFLVSKPIRGEVFDLWVKNWPGLA